MSSKTQQLSLIFSFAGVAKRRLKLLEIIPRTLIAIASFCAGITGALIIGGYHYDNVVAARVWKWAANQQTSNLATIGGYVLITAGGIFAYQRWSHDRRVKRIELLMERFRSFDDSPGAQNAVMMMYNHDRMIPLWSPDEPPERRYVRVTWSEVEIALIPHAIYPVTFNRKLTAIRDCFEDYLNRLSQLWMYLELGVIKQQDAATLMAPWLRRFGLMEHRSKVMRNLIVYIRWRKLENVQALFNRFGVDLNANVLRDWESIDLEVNGKSTTDAHFQLAMKRNSDRPFLLRLRKYGKLVTRSKD